MVCGCLGLVGLHPYGPFISLCMYAMRLVWLGWLKLFSSLPVVGFFISIGWFLHVPHAIGWV
ncbi:hypothetical protein NC652_029513 [Populus alba x Populus x berolinensis]|nr:hypothetical protein NC652_029513 [Populus alba x Populus x berolinensis]